MLRAALATLALSAIAVLAAGCGSDDERSLASGATDRRDPGIFDEDQVIDVNRAVADYNRAIVAWQEKTPECRIQTRRLLKLKARASRVLKCHVDVTASTVRSVRELRRVTAGLDGDWNEECADALVSTRTFLTGYEHAWSTVLADWTTLSRGHRASLDADIKVAYRLALAIGRRQLPTVHAACMEPADVAEGHRLAALAANDSRPVDTN